METTKLNLNSSRMNKVGIRARSKKIMKAIVGKEADKGLLFKAFIYLVLIDTAYIFLNPILFMITSMIKDSKDLIDPAVIWIPTSIYLGVLQDAWHMLDYNKAFAISAAVSTTSAILQTCMCAVAGYAFARLEFPFKKILFSFLLLSFIVPPQVITLPNLLMAREFNLMNTYIPILLPSLFGHGLKGALFVIIFRQFFSIQPKELEDAAKIDGANVFRIFYKVMLPLAKPSIVVVFLFSFVWNWNDFYFPSMYLTNTKSVPLSLGISTISEQLRLMEEQIGPSIFYDPIRMATAFLIILPLVILYLFTQRRFVEGVERTGLVE